MKKAIISLLSIFLIFLLVGCNEKPLINSADIHYFSIDTDFGRCYTNTTGKYLYSENQSGKISRNPFGRNIRDLSYSNGIIYYIDEWFENNKTSYVLYAFDGNESKAIADAQSYSVVENSIFYTNENKLYKLEDTSKEPEVIVENIAFTDFDADSKYIYFEDGKTAKKDIYRLNHKNGKIEKLTENANVYEFKVKDGFIYYIDMKGECLYKFDTYNKTTQTIIPASNDYYISFFHFSDGWIYFNDGQMRIRPDGTEMQKLFSLADYQSIQSDLARFDIDSKYMYFSKTLEDTKTNLLRVPLTEIESGNIITIQILDPFDSKNRWKTYKSLEQ